VMSNSHLAERSLNTTAHAVPDELVSPHLYLLLCCFCTPDKAAATDTATH
jgi:hypothetical protein